MLQLILGMLLVAYIVRLIVVMSRGVTGSRVATTGLVIQLLGAIAFVPFILMLSLVLVVPSRVMWLSLLPGSALTIIGVILWAAGRRSEREPFLPRPTLEQQRAIDDDMWGWEPNAEKFHKPEGQ